VVGFFLTEQACTKIMYGSFVLISSSLPCDAVRGLVYSRYLCVVKCDLMKRILSTPLPESIIL
jgi:hypothetical protein